MSWDDVQLFLQRANNFVPNMVLRLPSEAEWEYACRAGSSTAFSFGNGITPSQANYDGNRGKTVVVKSFSPNPWGLYQMHGNVGEWCQDVWDDYENMPTDGSVAQNGDSGLRVLRGGSWDDFPDWLRSAYRGNYSPVYRRFSFGFRLVCVLPFAER